MNMIYIAKSKREVLPLVSEVSKILETMQLHREWEKAIFLGGEFFVKGKFLNMLF